MARRIVSVLAATTLAACAGPAGVEVEDAWVRLPAAPGRPAAAYLTIEGGSSPRTLIRVTADYALRSELHETVTVRGRASMRPLSRVPIPAGGEVRFEPGGRHVMLFGLDPRAKKGATTLLTLTFADGQRLYRKAYMVGPGQEAPF